MSESVIDSVERFRSEMLSQRGLDPAIVDQPGLSVVAEESRAGSRIVAGYVYGEHFAIFVDPACESRIGRFDVGSADDLDTALDRFGAFVQAAGAEILGSGVMRVLDGAESAQGRDLSLAEPAVGQPAVGQMVAMDRDQAADVARIQALVDACTAEEVDDAAIEMDELDPVIRCVERDAGADLIAYASAFPEVDFVGRWDIGVLTHPEHRRKGLGALAVQRLVTDLIADGQVPIYRHNLDNVGSASLANSLGFSVATTLLAARFPDDS